jgi:hypothetical protein
VSSNNTTESFRRWISLLRATIDSNRRQQTFDRVSKGHRRGTNRPSHCHKTTTASKRHHQAATVEKALPRSKGKLESSFFLPSTPVRLFGSPPSKTHFFHQTLVPQDPQPSTQQRPPSSTSCQSLSTTCPMRCSSISWCTFVNKAVTTP